jgi:hypothetical protein
MSLAELLVALGVLVPVLVVALGIFPFSHLLNHQAADLDNAYDLARSAIESARNLPFDSIPAGPTSNQVAFDGTVFVYSLSSAPYGPAAQNPIGLKKSPPSSRGRCSKAAPALPRRGRSSSTVWWCAPGEAPSWRWAYADRKYRDHGVAGCGTDMLFADLVT